MATITYLPAAAGGGGTITTSSPLSGDGSVGTPATIAAGTVALLAGVSGGQTLKGGTLTTENITVRPNAADTTTGRAIVQGLGLQVPAGAAATPGIAFAGSNGGIFSPNGSVQFEVGGVSALYIDNTTVETQSNADGSGFFMGTSGRAAMTFDAGLGAGTPGLKFWAGFPSTVYLAISGVGAITFPSTATFGAFGATAVAQQTIGANVNNVVASGTTGRFDDFTSLTVYASDAPAIHASIYQLARSVTQITVALRNIGLGA